MKLVRRFELEEYDEPYRDEKGKYIRCVVLFNDKNERAEVGEVIDIEGVLYKVIANYRKFSEIQSCY